MKKVMLYGALLSVALSSVSATHSVHASPSLNSNVASSSAKDGVTSDLPSSLSFTNVYEFEPSTYRALSSYNNVSFSFDEPNTTTLKLNSNSINMDEELDYVLKKSDDESVTLLRGSKQLDENTLLSFNMVFDDIKNANGNITITKEVINPTTKEKEYEEKNIRFVNGVDSAQEIILNIQKNRASNANTNSVSPLAAIDYPTNIDYKYGNKFYAGYFLNRSYITGNGGTNPLQIKIKPQGAAYSYTDSTGAVGKLKEDVSGITKINFRFERLSGQGLVIYPIVNKSVSNTFDLGISYAGIGTTLKIPHGGSNSAQDGNLGRWDLNDIYLDMEKNGVSADAFYLYGDLRGNGNGTVTVSTGAHVTLGAVYVFGNKPAAIVNIKEDIPFANKTISVK